MAKLPEAYDKRRKLSENDREEIRLAFARGRGRSQLAADYGVSRALIRLLTNEEAAKSEKARLKVMWRKYAPPKEVQRARCKAYRDKLKALKEQGVIV